MEYVVTLEGRLIWGPREWNPFSIEGMIKSQSDIDVTLGTTPVVGWIVSNKIACFAVNRQPLPPTDGIFVVLAGPYFSNYSLQDGTVDVTYEAKEDSVPYVASKIKNFLKTIRDKKENSGVNINLNGKDILFPTTREHRERFFLQSLHNQSVVWRIDGNQYLDLSIEHQQQIVAQVNDHVQNAFKWEAEMSAKIDQCNTVKNLKQVYDSLQELLKEPPTE